MKCNLPIRLAADAELPGPDRRRRPVHYFYRQTYRDPNPRVVGCVATWDVLGGREVYQIALERDSAGQLHWHCTCPDAVYRGERFGRVCKHVVGLGGGEEAAARIEAIEPAAS